jgi:hypothetical protein
VCKNVDPSRGYRSPSFNFQSLPSWLPILSRRVSALQVPFTLSFTCTTLPFLFPVSRRKSPSITPHGRSEASRAYR